jgi:hypothetical protein
MEKIRNVRWPFRWSMRDVTWALIVVSLTLSLVVVSPIWKRATLNEVLLPSYVKKEVVDFSNQVDYGFDYSSSIVLIGSDVVLDVELHRINDLTTEPSAKTLENKIRVAPGRYGIIVGKQEEKAATLVYCVCNGKLLRASLARQNSNIRECSTTFGGPPILAMNDRSVIATFVENRGDPSRTERLLLVLLCLDNPDG